MKVINILTNLLKQICKDNVHNIIYGMDKDHVYITQDRCVAFKIPADKFLIDLSKALPKKIPIADFDKKFFYDRDSEDAVKTNEIRNISGGHVVKIANNKTFAWVNEKYLKDFDKDCMFKIVAPKSPVFVYEEDEIVGLIMPVHPAIVEEVKQ